MSLISGIINILGSLESDKIAIHEERCIAVRNRNADCLRCAEACTSGAISYANNNLSIEPERCIGCGTCATACPTCAIEITSPSDDELTKRMKSTIVATNGHPVFACETALAEHKSSDTAAARRVRAQGAPTCDDSKVCILPCLGRLDESILIGLAAYKATSATLVCGSCSTCTHATGGEMVRSVITSSRNLLDAFGSDFTITLEDHLPARACAPRTNSHTSAPDGASRRDFFKSVKDTSIQAAASAVDDAIGTRETQRHTTPPAYQKVNKHGTLSHFIPTRRTRVYNYLNHLGEPLTDTVTTRIMGSVSINTEQCSSCRMCAVFCPTGALQKIDDADTFGILHRPSACMQCRLCENLCPEQALTVSEDIPIKQFMGKQALCFSMKHPNWTPNKPDSMYNKIHDVIGPDKQMCMF